MDERQFTPQWQEAIEAGVPCPDCGTPMHMVPDALGPYSGTYRCPHCTAMERLRISLNATAKSLENMLLEARSLNVKLERQLADARETLKADTARITELMQIETAVDDLYGVLLETALAGQTTVQDFPAKEVVRQAAEYIPVLVEALSVYADKSNWLNGGETDGGHPTLPEGAETQDDYAPWNYARRAIDHFKKGVQE